jgi:hypothetical protein
MTILIIEMSSLLFDDGVKFVLVRLADPKSV